MLIYKVTAFDKEGKALLDEGFEAANEGEAKTIGMSILQKHDLSKETHRCISPTGKLILFHR